MKELSLNILDIAENSLKAGAALTEILIFEDEQHLRLTIRDNGCGMKEEVLKGVTDPFYTTRTTRKVGMGLPLLKLEAEQTGGTFEITSKHEAKFPCDHGTTVTAQFNKDHIDFTPLGDTVSTVLTLIQGHEDRDFLFEHRFKNRAVRLDTRELREQLGDVPLGTYEVLAWIKAYLNEQYGVLYQS